MPLIVPTGQTRHSGGRLFAVRSVQPTPDGQTFVVVASETSNHRHGAQLVLGWDPRGLGHRWSSEHVVAAGLAPDGERVAVLRRWGIELVAAATGERLAEFAAPDRGLGVVAGTSALVALAEASDTSEPTAQFVLLDLAGGSQPSALRGSAGFVDDLTALALAPDERGGPATLGFAADGVLLVGACDGAIWILDTEQPQRSGPAPPRATTPLSPALPGAARADAEARARLGDALPRYHEAGLFVGLDVPRFEAAVRASGLRLAEFSSTDLAALLAAGEPQPGARIVATRRSFRGEPLHAIVRALLAMTGLEVATLLVEDARVTLDAQTVTCRHSLAPLAAWCDARLAAAGRSERVYVHDADGRHVALALCCPDTPEARALERLLFDRAE